MSLVYITVYLIPRPPTVICISSPTHPSVESYKSTCVFTSKVKIGQKRQDRGSQVEQPWAGLRHLGGSAVHDLRGVQWRS